MAKVTDAVAQLALPYVEAAGCTLWDVEYVKGLSFSMDCRVLALTVKAVFSRSGVAEDTNRAEGNFALIRKERLERTGKLKED